MFQKVLATAMTVVQVLKIAVTITKLYVKISRKPGNLDCPQKKLPEGNIFSRVCQPVTYCTRNTPTLPRQ